MHPDWWITFLGTSSGGGPSASRNCSSLVCNFAGNDALWMVDCAEGTVRQFAFQPRQGPWLKLHNVTKLFVTHMHADHVMGITTLLRNSLYPPPMDVPPERSHKPAKVEIYGPAGIRIFVRSNLNMTLSRCSENYVVHELLVSADSLTTCEPAALHVNELPGQNILCSEDGIWRNITRSSGYYGTVSVDAGPIAHRDPCIGYVFRETFGSMRKVVILGDTHDPSQMIPLCQTPPGLPPPALLIHEATDAHIPQSIDPRAKRSPELVREKALTRGHSLPEMAGTFAKKIDAQRLILNHIGSRFPTPRIGQEVQERVIQEIERQASTAWGMGKAVVAWDYLNITIPPIFPQVPTTTEYPLRRSD